MSHNLWGLFSASFLAATLLPGGSEALLIYLANQHPQALLSLWLIATLGNTLGGMVSWAMGLAIQKGISQKLINLDKHDKTQQFIERYGAASLLLGWIPIIGDPICLIAGYLKTPWFASLIYLAMGKGLRYLFVLLILEAWF